MAFNTGWVFFCSESDYPKFLPFLGSDASPTYRDFLSWVDQRIKNREEQITTLKANCSFEAWQSWCKARGHAPNHESLDLFCQHVWASLPNA